MQRVYATSLQALKLLAETQTVLGAVRQDNPSLPASGQVSDAALGNPHSLDVLTAPRPCETYIVGHEPFTLELMPREGASINAVVHDAIADATPEAVPQPNAPRPDQGF